MRTFNEYQRRARETAIYPELSNNLWYPALGLSGESGEVAETVKKIYRDHSEPEDYVPELVLELGDVLWYLSNVASEAGISLEHVAEMNLKKLAKRKADGRLHGSGSSR